VSIINGLSGLFELKPDKGKSGQVSINCTYVFSLDSNQQSWTLILTCLRDKTQIICIRPSIGSVLSQVFHHLSFTYPNQVVLLPSWTRLRETTCHCLTEMT